MPKTVDANAFRNFDSERILSRPYFKPWREKYPVEGKNDNEILAAVAPNALDVARLEICNAALAGLLFRLEEFFALVQRHASLDGRLERYRRRVVSCNLNRLNELARFYLVDVARAIDGLTACVRELWQQSEDGLQAAYRQQFGARLKAAREQAGLSRKEFAAACAISGQQLYYYENGKRDVSMTFLIRTARKLNVSTDWLLGVKEQFPTEVDWP